jgi:hypothetical protein
VRRSPDRSPAGTLKSLTDLRTTKTPRTVPCPHVLGRHLLRTARSTQQYPDGGPRSPELRGGRLIVQQAPCVWAPGHTGDHKAEDGRTWP